MIEPKDKWWLLALFCMWAVGTVTMLAYATKTTPNHTRSQYSETLDQADIQTSK
jgi:hypothetical protein